MPVSPCHPATPREAAALEHPLDLCLDLELFRALAEPTRLTLMSALIKCGRPCSATELAEIAAVDFSVANRHLKVLASAGLLGDQRKGRQRFYVARCPEIVARFEALCDAITAWCPNLGRCRPRDLGRGEA
jgi:DNA-binding transcriptional ArsR family regulator